MNSVTIIMKLVIPVTHTHTGGENSRLKSRCCHVVISVFCVKHVQN